MPTNHSYLELLETNDYLQKAADSFYFQCTARTVQESKLFPVNPYISLSYLQRLVPLARAAAQDRRSDAGRGDRRPCPPGRLLRQHDLDGPDPAVLPRAAARSCSTWGC